MRAGLIALTAKLPTSMQAMHQHMQRDRHAAGVGADGLVNLALGENIAVVGGNIALLKGIEGVWTGATKAAVALDPLQRGGAAPTFMIVWRRLLPRAQDHHHQRPPRRPT